MRLEWMPRLIGLKGYESFFFLLPLRCVFDPPCRNSFLSGWCQDGMSPFLSQVYVVVG